MTLLVIIGGFGQGYKGAQSPSEVTLVLDSASVALGQDSTITPRKTMDHAQFFPPNSPVRNPASSHGQERVRGDETGQENYSSRNSFASEPEALALPSWSMAKTLRSQCRQPWSDPLSGN